MGRGDKRHPVKQDGQLTKDWCICCGNFHCDPMCAPFIPTPAMRKSTLRFEQGLCRGCGKAKCKCKNKKGY